MTHNYRISLDIVERPTFEDVVRNVAHGGFKVYNMKSEKEYRYFPNENDYTVEIIHFENGELFSNFKTFKSIKAVAEFLINDGTDESDWWYGYFED